MPTWLEGPWGWILGALAVLVLLTALFVALLPWSICMLLRVLLGFRYRLKVVGLEHIPRTGPGVLALNHVSWIDGFILAAICPRPGKVLVSETYIGYPIIKWLAVRSGMIPVPARGPKGHRAVIAAAQAALDRGELLALFPEAQISRTGVPGVLYRGLEIIMSGREHVPIIPGYLDNLWGSIFSFSGGRFFKKWPRGWRRTIGVVFGPPIPSPLRLPDLRQAMVEAGVIAFDQRPAPDRAFLPETLLPDLPRWVHPQLGLLAASAPDFHRGDITQTGTKPGSVGQSVPGVALRSSPDGHLLALLSGHPSWIDTGRPGHVDRDGFVFLDDPE